MRTVPGGPAPEMVNETLKNLKKFLNSERRYLNKL